MSLSAKLRRRLIDVFGDRDVAEELAVAVSGASLNSPAFTGTPTAPTASPGTDTTQVATTAFVTEAVTAATYDPNAPMVLEFTGADGCHVDHGFFWLLDEDTVLGAAFWWEAWLAPLSPGYVVADGYGGPHALDWGVTGSAGGPYTITGNVWNGAAQSYSGSYQFADGEWAHIAVALKSGNLYTWVNGIGDTITPFSGSRKNPAGTGSGTGKLFVGGPDHNNLAMRLAAIRAFDRGQYVPTVDNAFAPERFWAPSTLIGSTLTQSDFCCDYTTASEGLLPDFSDGVIVVTGGDKARHPGRRMDVGQGASNFIAGVQPATQTGTAPPRWASDAGCPYNQPIGSPLPTELTHTPAAVPTGALVFDSFARRNQTFAFQATPTLGSTEGGTLGILAWQSTHARPVMGLLGGWARMIGNGPHVNYFASGNYVDAGTADVDIRVTRDLSTGSPGITGILFRLQDNANFNYAYVGGSGLNTSSAGSVIAGDSTPISFWDAGSHTVIRVVAKANVWTIYGGDGTPGGWTQLIQYTGQSAYQTATKHGLSSPPNSGYAALGGFARFRNFTIFPAP